MTLTARSGLKLRLRLEFQHQYSCRNDSYSPFGFETSSDNEPQQRWVGLEWPVKPVGV